MRNCTGDAERSRHGASGPCHLGLPENRFSETLVFRHPAIGLAMKTSVDTNGTRITQVRIRLELESSDLLGR